MQIKTPVRSAFALSLTLSVVALAGLSATAATAVPAPGKPAAPAAGSVARAATMALSLGTARLGVHQDSSYPGSKMTNFYNQVKFTCPTSAAQGDLAAGDSINITFASNANPDYVTKLVAGDATAVAWMNKAIACVKTLSDYATTKNNGSYVVGSFWHEGGCKKGASKGYVPDNPVALGQAQQIAMKAGKAAAPNAVWQLWLCGFDDAWEKKQADQVVNPKPDIITVDPYAHSKSCNATLTSTVTRDFTWVKSLASYTGYVGISETGMTNTCTDTQLAGFYGSWSGQITAIEKSMALQVGWVTFFNSDAGAYPHAITQSARPKAFAAIGASMAGQ